MAVPKNKSSQSRRDKRRSSVSKITPPELMRCPQCGEYKVAHQVCYTCGYYKGQNVINMDSNSAK